MVKKKDGTLIIKMVLKTSARYNKIQRIEGTFEFELKLIILHIKMITMRTLCMYVKISIIDLSHLVHFTIYIHTVPKHVV